MPSFPATFAEDVINQPPRAQFEAFLDEHRGELDRCLDGLTEEQARQSLVPSRTTLLGLVKHATFVEKVWFDEAVTGRSRAEIGIPAISDESFILHDDDTIASVQQVITACDLIPGARRQGLRLLARPAPAALGVSPRTARTRPALRACRHLEGADPQRVARLSRGDRNRNAWLARMRSWFGSATRSWDRPGR
jgi:Protein of unknown function (DUF664)